MRDNWIEPLVGAVVLIAAGVFLTYLLVAGDARPAPDGYTLTARFGQVGGLREGDDVRVAGVKVGRVERIALQLKNRHGLRVWLDKWEVGTGPLHDQCRDGVMQSRFTLLAISQAALDSKWVAAEQNWARAYDPQGWHILPLVFEKVHLPADLQSLRWVDMTNPARDMENSAEIMALIGTEAGEDRSAEKPARFRPATREKEQDGAFPPAPIYGFHGRAHELYELERQFRSHRAILLHAMGGMGKTTLASEAAHWWTRTGLFPDGACFLSFEQFASAERVIQLLGTYLDGTNFNALSAEKQRKRAKKLFR